MGKFLTTTDVEGGSSSQIRDILKGGNVKIASAFLGTGAENEVAVGSRLICDIGMGGTNPAALKALSDKLGKDNLRYLTNFHAKIYLSDQGCLVGSANLSNNGVGFLSQAKMIEASICVSIDDAIAISANKWFEQLWSDAKIVGDAEIEWAETTWKSSKRGTPLGGRRYGSFLDALDDAENGIAGKWSFLLTRDQLSTYERAVTKEAEESIVNEIGPKPLGRIDAYTYLTNRRQLDGYYIGLHRGGRGRLYLNALKFIGNLDLKNEDGSKLKSSYFSLIPWQETHIPPILDCFLSKDSALSNYIGGLKEEKPFGRALGAKKFSEIIRRGIEGN